MEAVFDVKSLLYITCIVLALFILISSIQPRDKSLFVMCDVGTGDGMYIRTTSQIDIVIDFGSGRDILDCLGTNMPFMDRTIELAMISHQHYDHYGGLASVLEKYHINTLITPDGTGTAQYYNQYIDQVSTSKTQIMNIREFIDTSSSMHFSETEWISCMYPSSDDISLMQKEDKNNENTYSQICVFTHGDTNVLLTGDAPPHVLQSIIAQDRLARYGQIELLKVPHHGSKVGLTDGFLAYVKPDTALVSVGKNNSYGHPSPEVIRLLKKHNVETYVTSIDGSVRIKITPDGTFSTQ